MPIMYDGGKFITFEGPEGSGKTTHIALLKKYLSKKGFSVLTTREPGGEKISEKIRKILLSPLSSLEPVAELLLYAASRIQHVERVIKPAMRKGKIVISDRFYDATFAYQGCGRGINEDVVKAINSISISGLKPHLTILLDIEPAIGLKRLKNVKKAPQDLDRIERESLVFHRKVRTGYLRLAESEPGRIKVVRVGKINETQEKIRRIAAGCLSVKY